MSLITLLICLFSKVLPSPMGGIKIKTDRQINHMVTLWLYIYFSFFLQEWRKKSSPEEVKIQNRLYKMYHVKTFFKKNNQCKIILFSHSNLQIYFLKMLRLYLLVFIGTFNVEGWSWKKLVPDITYIIDAINIISSLSLQAKMIKCSLY